MGGLQRNDIGEAAMSLYMLLVQQADDVTKKPMEAWFRPAMNYMLMIHPLIMV